MEVFFNYYPLLFNFFLGFTSALVLRKKGRGEEVNDWSSIQSNGDCRMTAESCEKGEYMNMHKYFRFMCVEEICT